MTFAPRGPTSPARNGRGPLAARLISVSLGLSLLTAGCSDPPQPVPEPTGDDLERAWRVAVGSDPLDQTIAQVYAMAMNSHETPTVVVQSEDETAVELAVALAEGDSEPQEEDPEGQSGEDSDGAGDTPDEGYEIVLARTMPLAEALDLEGYENLTGSDASEDMGPAAEPDDLLELVEFHLGDAELFEPTAAVLHNGLIMTTITAETYEIDAEDDTAFDTFGENCQELALGVAQSLPEPGELLSQTYGCSPEEIHAHSEGDLIDLLTTAEIDAAVMSTSHPEVYEHALVTVSDTRRAFPLDQYAPVVSSRIAEDVPGVVDDISLALDDEALLTLRRLIHGEDALDPEDAAIYWLVEEGLLAEPEDWG